MDFIKNISISEISQDPKWYESIKYLNRILNRFQYKSGINRYRLQCITTNNSCIFPSIWNIKPITRIIPPDEKVWFTQESVVKGEDDVEKAALKWMNNLVYGHDITLSNISLKPAIDTLKISALVENHNSHQTSSKIIKSLEGNFIDSLELNKTGLSNKSELCEGNYSASDSEGIFSISLSVKDISESKTWTTDNISRFTTAGPVILDSISFQSLAHFYAAKPFIKNESRSLTIENTSVKLISNDPWVSNITPSIKNLPNINPG